MPRFDSIENQSSLGLIRSTINSNFVKTDADLSAVEGLVTHLSKKIYASAKLSVASLNIRTRVDYVMFQTTMVDLNQFFSSVKVGDNYFIIYTGDIPKTFSVSLFVSSSGGGPGDSIGWGVSNGQSEATLVDHPWTHPSIIMPGAPFETSFKRFVTLQPHDLFVVTTEAPADGTISNVNIEYFFEEI